MLRTFYFETASTTECSTPISTLSTLIDVEVIFDNKFFLLVEESLGYRSKLHS